MIAFDPAIPVVVDASAGIKWVVHEEGSQECIALFDERLRLIVPDLFYLETANVLGKKADRGEIEAERARELYRAIRETPLEAVPSVAWIERALVLATGSGRSLYDSIYLSIALSADGFYVTADEKYVNGLSQTRPDLRFRVLRVADIPRWLLNPSLSP